MTVSFLLNGEELSRFLDSLFAGPNVESVFTSVLVDFFKVPHY